MASDDEWGILHCAVLKGDQVLSHCSSVEGNFLEFSRTVLEKSDNLSRDKATYASGNYMLHYMKDGPIMYLCITDDEFERSKAFLFLSDIRKRFILHRKQPKAPDNDITFTSIISEQMEYYSRRFLPQLESINTYRNQLNELEDIEVHDIGSLAGDHVRLLPFSSTGLDIDDSDVMMSSGTYSLNLHRCASGKSSRHVALCCFILIALFAIIFFVTVFSCGGFRFEQCR